MPQPGDFAVVKTHSLIAVLICAVTRSKVNHAFVWMGDGTIVEAMPTGAQRVPLHYPPQDLRWSSLPLTVAQRARIVDNAAQFVGLGYGFLDIVSVGLLQYGVRLAWVRRRVASSKRLICSQLVDTAYAFADVHLFTDGRLPMDVTPGDLAHLIESRKP